MLFPEDPKRRPDLWDAVATQLAEHAMCFIIKEGVGNPLAEAKGLLPDEAKLVLARLQGAEVCRISANRGLAISPHFAGRREGDLVMVTDLLTYPSEGASTVDSGKLERDLETAVINLLFAVGGANTVLVPLSLEPWAMQDAEITLTRDGLMFSKRNLG
jgi:hypothetical protein